MNACTRSSVSRRSGADRRPSPGRPRARARPACSRSVTSGTRSRPRGFELERAEQLAQHRRQVLAQPRHAAELQRVRHLVQRDPAQQLVGGRVERASRRGRGWARRTAAARAASGSSTGNSYWPSTRPARKPETAPASIASTPPAIAPSGPALAARAAAPRARAPSPATSRLASIQPGAVDRLGGRHRLARRRARCRRRRAARPPPRARSSCSNGAGSPAGCRLATPRATVPASFQSITRSRMAGVAAGYGQTGTSATAASPSRVRAAITGECGSRSSGAASGSS